MIPETLLPARFHIAMPPTENDQAENNENLTQGKISTGKYETDILTATRRYGQPGNVLLEERDRHIKDRLFRAIKIETFAYVLGALQAEGEVSAQELSQIINEKTTDINHAGNDIWLNLITLEKSCPLFYDFQVDIK